MRHRNREKSPTFLRKHWTNTKTRMEIKNQPPPRLELFKEEYRWQVDLLEGYKMSYFKCSSKNSDASSIPFLGVSNPLESCCVLIGARRSSSHAADWNGEGNEKYFEPLEVLNLCLYKIASVRTSSNSPNVYPFCCWWFQMKPRSSLWFPLENISPPEHTCMCLYV